MRTNNDAKIRVIFRIFPQGDIIALFPEIPWNQWGDITSYQHIGQHGPAEYDYCIKISKPATPKQYAELKRELISLGYQLDIKKRR